MMSPPFLPRPLIVPASTTQPSVGKACFAKPFHPVVVRPSNSSFQPSAFSFGQHVLRRRTGGALVELRGDAAPRRDVGREVLAWIAGHVVRLQPDGPV